MFNVGAHKFFQIHFHNSGMSTNFAKCIITPAIWRNKVSSKGNLDVVESNKKNQTSTKKAGGVSSLLAFVIVSLLPTEILASIVMWICPCLCFLTGSLEGAERASVKKGGGSLILFCLLSLFLF